LVDFYFSQFRHCLLPLFGTPSPPTTFFFSSLPLFPCIYIGSPPPCLRTKQIRILFIPRVNLFQVWSQCLFPCLFFFVVYVLPTSSFFLSNPRFPPHFKTFFFYKSYPSVGFSLSHVGIFGRPPSHSPLHLCPCRFFPPAPSFPVFPPRFF